MTVSLIGFIALFALAFFGMPLGFTMVLVGHAGLCVASRPGSGHGDGCSTGGRHRHELRVVE